MKRQKSLLILVTAFILQLAGTNLQAVNYAISLPGGPNASTNNGAYSNIDISGVPLTTLPYTIEMWVSIKERQVQYAGLVYHRVDASVNSGVQFAANWQMNTTPNAIRVNNNTSGYGLISDTLTLNNWHHIAIVITESSRTCYVDGNKTTENVAIPVYDFSTGHMWIGRDSANASNDNRAFKGLIDEVRIWNVARTEEELEANKYLTLTGSEPGLIGYWNFNDSAAVATDLSPTKNNGIITGGTYVRATPNELKTAVGTLSIGNLKEVTSNLTLPTSTSGGVTIRWATSNASVIDTLGNVNRPEQYDATVKLTATLTMVEDGITYTFTKNFTAIVKAKVDAAMQLAEWDFATDHISLNNGIVNVKDASENGFTATLKNDATIRTIGKTDQYNVLDLGSGKGYLDMGTDIGKAVYSLNNYTICGYFRIQGDYAGLTNDGNFFWTLSNTADATNDKTGYIIGSLKTLGQSVSRMNNTLGSQTVAVNANAEKGKWHHFAYTQKGEVGTVYIDGEEKATGTVTNIPSLALYQSGRTGTLYNWLGRSPYTSDSYLQKTLLYDFQLWRDAMTGDDLNYTLNVPDMVDKLNNAFGEDSCYILPELTAEKAALTLPDLSALKTDITLPVQGTNDPSITILWKSSHPAIISTTGQVTRPTMYPANVTLTATLFKNGQQTTKTFPATVEAIEGTGFTGNLLVKYDFNNVSDTVVTDAAEKHFKGALVNKATIRPIGESTIFHTLDLTDSTAYFDMGQAMGPILYNLKDYTMSCYYRVDESNTWLGNAGNFLWTFSNSNKTGTDKNGCLFGGLRSQTMSISPTYYSSEQSVSVGLAASTGGWHNFTYVQKDTTGTIYLDGVASTSKAVTWLPSNTLPINGRTGTNYNWLGRSPYVGDAYLSKALLYDFRIYNKALTDDEIQNSELNVAATINALETAWIENPNIPASVKTARNNDIRIYTTGNGIRINGLTGNEKINLFDLTGRQIQINNPADITLSRGLYLIKVDHTVTKVMVR